jgi:DNA-binding CsgD family transcriptional regulator
MSEPGTRVGSKKLLCKEKTCENEDMKAPLYVRTLSPAELAGIEVGLRSSDAFTLRRSQILLASNRKQRPKEIARNLGCATQTVRNAIHAFH